VAVTANKGGVGKSTTALQVGVEAAGRGLRVLLIDADKQADLTYFAGVAVEPWRGLDGVLRDPPSSLDPRPFLRPRARDGETLALRVLGSSPRLQEVDAVVRDGLDEGTYYLRRALDVIDADFDLAVIDLGHSDELVRNVLVCADVIVIPTPAMFPDARHAADMVHEVGRVRADLGLPRLEAMQRTVVSPWRRHRNAAGDARVLEQLQEAFGDALSPMVLPECSYVSEANANQMTLREYRDAYVRNSSPLNALVDGYSSLTDHILARVPLEVAL
jgi:chromosome partitioning protein